MNKSHSSVYFIQEVETKRIKIGCTVNVKKRLSELKNSNIRQLNIIKVIEGGKELEKEIHAKFKEIRIEREWFGEHPELLKFINELPANSYKKAEQYTSTFTFDVSDFKNKTVITPLNVIIRAKREQILKCLNTAKINSKNGGYYSAMDFAIKIIEDTLNG